MKGKKEAQTGNPEKEKKGKYREIQGKFRKTPVVSDSYMPRN